MRKIVMHMINPFTAIVAASTVAFYSWMIAMSAASEQTDRTHR